MSYLNKTSLLVPSQLPEFVRDDANYQNFVTFLKAYYEWTEQQNNVLYGSKNLLSYTDIDTTLDDFIKYYRDEFLAFFPEGSLVDERKLTKIAKELYQTKGTPASYEFLFRVLYNSQVNLYNTRDYVFRASDGKWIVTRSLKLATNDPTWLNTINYRLFGQTSQGYATIEDVIIGLNGITQVVLSGIDRNFTSGEYVTVVDIHGAPVLFNGQQLTAQILGVLSSITVDPAHNGSGYNVGDPVVFYGGLNPAVANPVPASAYISQVSGAAITGVNPIYRGQGYRPGGYTSIQINSGSGTGSGAADIATTFDGNPYYISFVNTDTIGNKANVHINSSNYGFANLTNANVNSTLQQALSFPILNTFGIFATTVTSGGTGYDATTSATATGYYQTETGSLESLPSLGILAPIQIRTAGVNYHVNDTIVFTGGNGQGAYANVTAVSGNGSITQITYVLDPARRNIYPLGGQGYTADLPTVSVNTATGSGASLYIPGLVGGDAIFGITSTSYGQVQQITLTNAGQNYIAAPGISLRVEDILVYNVNVLNEPMKGDIIYQGTTNNTTFVANVDSITIYSSNTANAYFSTYNLRVYDYSGSLNINSGIKVLRSGADAGINLSVSNTTTGIYTQGRKIYGNGSARATANFLNGVVLGAGIYQNADGQPSAYSVLEDQTYNNYTYILQVEQALQKYKNTALSFLHPSGMNYSAFNVLRNVAKFTPSMIGEELTVKSLGYLLDTNTYVANVSPTLSNTINIYNASGANVANVVFANSYVTIIPTRGNPFYSKVVNTTANTITLQDNWNTLVPNVAVATASSGSNVINISSITNSWNIATGNIVSYISDFINVYDQISFDGVTFKSITHVDQPSDLGGIIVGGSQIYVNTAFGSAQSGYLTLKSNVVSSNVYVSGIVAVQEVIDLLTEAGVPLTAENGSLLLLG
jgi:hypothetical protein